MKILTLLVIFQAALVVFSCHWACNTCFGAGQNQCNTCAVNFYLQPAPNQNYCGPTCPPGYYGNNTEGRCKVCDVSCLRCSPDSVHCEVCAPGYHWQGAYCVSDITVPTCNSNQWLNGNTCQNCHASCLTCNGAGDNKCTSCVSHQFVNANNKCKPCNANCDECSGTAATCTACVDGKYLNGNVCSSCHGDCETCDGPNADDCLSCDAAGAKPILVGTGCYPQCTGVLKPAGFIKCTTCTAANHCNNDNCRNAQVNCVNCAPGYHKENGLCVANRRNLRE